MSANPDEYLITGPRSFGFAIREFRKRAELTQEALAASTAVPRTYLSELEQGSTTEAVERIMRTLSALDLEVVVRPRVGS